MYQLVCIGVIGSNGGVCGDIERLYFKQRCKENENRRIRNLALV